MKNSFPYILSLFVAVAAAFFLWKTLGTGGMKTSINMSEATPPIAKKVPYEMTIHGHTRNDPYFWMRERDSQPVLDYLNAENAYAAAAMKGTEALQETLFEELKSRIKKNDQTYPTFEDGYFYYTRTEEDQEYGIHCRRKGSMEAPEEIYFDENPMAEGHDYFAVGAMDITKDGKLLIYAVDTEGDRKYTARILDLETRELLPDTIVDMTGNLCWAADDRTIFYGLPDETLRSAKILRHALGTDPDADVLVYEEADTTFDVSVSVSKSKEYLFIHSSSSITDEIRYLKNNEPNGAPVIFEPRTRGHEYDVDHGGGFFYINSNRNGATNFALYRTTEANTSQASWEEVLAPREDTLIEGFDIFDQFLAVEERHNGLTRFQILQGEESYFIPFNDPTYTSWLGNNPDVESTKIRFGYSSLTTPGSLFEWDVSTKEQTLLKQLEVLGGFKAEHYVSERLFATGHDGTQIPISLVYRKDLDRSTPAPLFQTGYGAYGISSDPYFHSNGISLLDRGFIYAIAHIRGGEDMGREWYDDGKMLQKKNTFSDFISCAKHLQKAGYTTPEQLVIEGGSAGGLLIGAVINEAPDLCQIALADVPFVDVVTTMLDESIPLTTGEFDEWGNPKEKEFYDYMLSYSPYDQVTAQPYPTLLVLTGYNDSQVQYWEPAKWVAKLRDHKTDDHPLVFKTEMEVGHAGKSGRFEGLHEVAYTYAFVIRELGLEGK